MNRVDRNVMTSTRQTARRAAVGFFVALSLPLVLTLVLASGSGAAGPTLPDLVMEPLTDIQIETTGDGHRLLRFTTVIANEGAGPFEVLGSRPDTATPTMTVSQVIYGGVNAQTVATPATMFFAGDGHSHWHVTNLEEYTLERLDNGVKVGTGAKSGYCFFDNAVHNLSLPGAPASPYYTNCGVSTSLSIRTGLSVGWGDKYVWFLAGQYIDITGLTAGTYRLRAIADPSNWFQESSDTNNGTYTDVNITGGSNQPPTAVIQATPASGPATLNVSFSGSGSSDPDGGSLTYEWDFTNDGVFDASGVTTSHAYGSPGTFTAVLKVTDNQGASDTDSTAITVTDPVPSTDVGITKTGVVSADRKSITYQIVVANNGPIAAGNIAVSDTLSAKVTYTSVATTLGACSYASSTRTVSCSLGSMSPSQTATITLVVGSTKNGWIDNTATVASDTPDSNAANNSSTSRLRR